MTAKKSLNLKPLEDRLVVKPLAAEAKTDGGIMFPDSDEEKPQRGVVVAAGAGRLLDNGKRAEMNVAVDDEVIYGKYSGSDVEVDGEQYKILRESDVLAKVVKTA